MNILANDFSLKDFKGIFQIKRDAAKNIGPKTDLLGKCYALRLVKRSPLEV